MISVVIATVMTLSSVAVASASNFYSANYSPPGCNPWTSVCGDVSLAWDGDQTWQAISFNGNVLASLRWSDVNVYDPTDMQFTEHSSGTSDVYLYDNNWADNGVVAWVDCPTYAQTTGSHPSRRCKGQEIHFNDYFWFDWAPGGVVNWTTLASLTTHEFGHTVGLQHYNVSHSAICEPRDDCNVNNGTVNPYLSAHDNAHINAAY